MALGRSGAADLPVDASTFDCESTRAAIADWGAIDAVGVRVAHGGGEFSTAVVVDGAVRDRIDALSDLAPLHQPLSVAALDCGSRTLVGVPVVACFDTAFHSMLPAAAATYALPQSWRERWGLRRYGFHGLSHSYIARRVPEMLGSDGATTRIVSCHLGAGASLAAVTGGRSVDTTMGFTPLDGLVMATRSGTVDPGLVLWLAQHAGLAVASIADALEHHSGLLGLTGTPDMQDVLARYHAGDELAELAVGIYVHRLRAGIAAMVAAMGGVDAIAFTGGVGERAPEIRALAIRGLDFLGVALEQAVNERSVADTDVSAATSRVHVLVIEAREDLQIANDVEALLAGVHPSP